MDSKFTSTDRNFNHLSLTQSYHEDLIVQPVSIPQKSSQANTFVHKLYNMVVDTQFQHLIAWNYTGASFIVCNIMEFARDVLPKHFKHNNFSSFVRQLNMYGFHKVNKSPRGHRTLAENQIWEFSHTKFIRDRPDLLDEIKRKTMESDHVRRETGDLQSHMAMLQVSQSDTLQQVNHLYDNFNQIVKELKDTKQKQESHYSLIEQIVQYISQENGGQLPHELDIEYNRLKTATDNSHHDIVDTTPSIFVTSHDQTNPYHNTTVHQQPLVRSQMPQSNTNANLLPSSPSSAFGSNLPPSPCPTMVLHTSANDNNSYYPVASQRPTSNTSTTYSFIHNNNSTMNG